MREPEDKTSADVLRAKRLEVVDDEGKVRAALGTDEEGVASLSMFDASGKLRVSLDASNVPEQSNGLALFDMNSELQVAVGASTIPEKGGGLSIRDENGKHRAGIGLHESGQAALSVSASQKERDIKISAEDEGDLRLMFAADDTLMAALGLAEREDWEISSEFMVLDKDAHSGVVLSGGRTSAPAGRLLER